MHPLGRAALTHGGSLPNAGLGCSHITACFAVNKMPKSRHKRNTLTDAGVVPTSQRNLCFLCHSLADYNDCLEVSSALRGPALWVEIPSREGRVSTHFIFHSGATDQRFVSVGPRRKKFAPQQGKAPAVHRNACQGLSVENKKWQRGSFP